MNEQLGWIEDDIIETRTVIFPDENRYTVELRLLLEGGVGTQAESLDGLLRYETFKKEKRDMKVDRKKQWGLLILSVKRKSGRTDF